MEFTPMPAETMTPKDFATRHGKSRMAVSKWERHGLLSFIAGKVEVAESEARMRDAGIETELSAFLNDLAAGKFATQTDADRVKANALAEIRVLEWRRKSGELFELGAAETAFFEAARNVRNALTAGPSSSGPLLAADLDMPAERVTDLLGVHVRQLLTTLAEPDGGALRDDDRR
jgi:hypothetical protein